MYPHPTHPAINWQSLPSGFLRIEGKIMTPSFFSSWELASDLRVLVLRVPCPRILCWAQHSPFPYITRCLLDLVSLFALWAVFPETILKRSWGLNLQRQVKCWAWGLELNEYLFGHYCWGYILCMLNIFHFLPLFTLHHSSLCCVPQEADLLLLHLISFYQLDPPFPFWSGLRWTAFLKCHRSCQAATGTSRSHNCPSPVPQAFSVVLGPCS